MAGKAKKTKEYRLEVNIYDTITTSIVISGTAYKKKLAELKRQVEETQPGPEESRAEEITRTIEHEGYTETIYRATIGMSDIELISIVCKPGFCFK